MSQDSSEPQPQSDPKGFLPTKAARAASQLGRTVNVALAESELTPAGYRMLAYLATGETAAKILAAKLAISRPTVTATLDWLEPRGYVRRIPAESDRRKVEITITAEGLRALEAADRLVVARLADVLSVVDPEELPVIIDSLETLWEALNSYRARGIDPIADAADGTS
jgi:DNA-binding MarR family transcriptional regulator